MRKCQCRWWAWLWWWWRWWTLADYLLFFLLLVTKSLCIYIFLKGSFASNNKNCKCRNLVAKPGKQNVTLPRKPSRAYFGFSLFVWVTASSCFSMIHAHASYFAFQIFVIGWGHSGKNTAEMSTTVTPRETFHQLFCQGKSIFMISMQ